MIHILPPYLHYYPFSFSLPSKYGKNREQYYRKDQKLLQRIKLSNSIISILPTNGLPVLLCINALHLDSPTKTQSTVNRSDGGLYPTKICINFTPYLNQKSSNWGLNLVLFLVLMLLTEFVPISTIRRCSSGTNFVPNSTTKVYFLHSYTPLQKLSANKVRDIRIKVLAIK